MGGKIIIYGASTGVDQPISQDGQLKITGGTLFAAGSKEMGGISATNSQNSTTISNTIPSGKTIIITDNNNNEIFSLKNKKEINYIYFTSSGSGFSVNVENTNIGNSTIIEISKSEIIIHSYIYLLFLLFLI